MKKLYGKDIINITKEVAHETQIFNIRFKKGRPGLNMRTNKAPLDNFYWPCFDNMISSIQKIHLKRTAETIFRIKNDLPEPTPKEQHQFFVDERIKAGWIYGDERVDFIMSNGKATFKGLDPFLMPLDKLPDWFQSWCIARNHINDNIVRKFL